MAGSMAIGGYGTIGNYGLYGNMGASGSTTQGSTQTAGTTAQSNASPDDQVKAGRRSSPSECKTCKTRKYQDGSDEGDVSFKAPGHISPQASAGTVRAHELQHVSNAYEKAAKRGGEVRSATVTLKTGVCPECGTTYIAGGETRTAIAYPVEENPYKKNQKALDAAKQLGSNVDYVA